MKLAVSIQSLLIFFFGAFCFNCLATLALLLMLFTVNATPGWSLCFCFNTLMLVTGH